MSIKDYPQYTPSEEDRMADEAYQGLLSAYLASNHRKKVEIIDRAYKFAREAHRGVRRLSGEPYIMHPIAVARIVISELGLGSTSICAALLHDVVEDTDYTRDDIAAAFGDKIADIVEGLTKISGGIFGDKASLQAENFRKLLLSMSTDIRVVLIKMADRLHNMRTLGSMRPEKQYKIAGETLYVYAPLAHRLGLFKIKQELEDLAFRYEHPRKYEEIMSLVNESADHRDRIVEEFVRPVREKLDAAGFKYEIKTRVKSAYSIYNKMEKKHIPFTEIYDIYAVRVIFENDDDSLERLRCWQIYTFFSDGRVVHPDRLRDWTAVPKANGYRALHLTAMGPEGKWIEVQIRSRKMDDIAELGYAAHWKYKSGVYEDETELDNWIRTIKDILANPEPNAIDVLDTIKLNLFSREIYVFTPKGDLYTLPAGSSVLDMAFAIHSELGIHCMAGKISHKLVPLSHILDSGDQVEIITSDTQSPKPEWLDCCHTAKARDRVRSILRKDRRLQARKGEEIYLDFLRQQSVKPGGKLLNRIVSHYKAENATEFYLMLARGDIASLAQDLPWVGRSKQSIFSKLLRNPFSSRRKEEMPAAEARHVNLGEVYVLRPGSSSNYRLAACCSPVPGDDVLGFVDDEENVVVHKVNCDTAMRLKSAYGPRLVATRWEGTTDRFMASISMEGLDRTGMIGDIANTVTGQLGINIRSLNIRADGEVFHADMTVQIDTTDTLDKIMHALKKISGIKSVKRMS